MSISMHELTVRTILKAFEGLSLFLDRAEADAAKRGYDVGVLLSARLAPDMLPLTRQVQLASDSGKSIAARLSGTELPSFPDTETTLPELRERIRKTVDFVAGIDPAKFEGSETRAVEVPRRGSDPLKFDGKDYLIAFGLPNFYFHITTAYAILRHNGVELGKRDYMSTPVQM